LDLPQSSGSGKGLHLADGNLVEPHESFGLGKTHVDELGVRVKLFRPA
jgi:hypothetical protein